MSTTTRLAAIVAAGALLFTACGDDDSASTDTSGSETTQASSETTQAPTSDAASDDGASGGGGDESAMVEIVDFTFMPSEVTASPGSEVTVLNMDETAHTFTATEDAGASFDTGDIPGGEQASVTAPEEAGDYPYFCSIHPYMKGTLIVE